MKFNEYSFRELLTDIVDNRGKTCPTADKGIPLIATNCIKNEALYPVHEKIRYVDQETYDNWFRSHPEPGDMIFVCKGSPGRVCWAADPIDFCIAQDMVAIRADETKVYPKYLFALLRSKHTQQKILNMHVGTLIPHFKKGDFGNLYFDIPEDMMYQEMVGNTYFEFCKKIELNRQTNQTLEQIAQAIFKSWFVDFEPTRAKIIAKEKGANAATQELAAQAIICGALTLEQLQDIEQDLKTTLQETINQKLTQQNGNPINSEQLQTTAVQFPNELVDSKLGEIPKGWEVNCLGDVTKELRRGISPKYSESNGVPVINQKCIRNHSINFELVRLNDPVKRKTAGREVEVGDVLVNSTGVGTLGRLAPVRYLPEPTVFDSHVTVVRADTSKISKAFLSGLMLNNEAFIESSGAGSTGQTELRKQVLEDIKFPMPTLELGNMFESIVEPINQKIAILELQQKSLSETRDSLLPKLLSSELKEV